MSTPPKTAMNVLSTNIAVAPVLPPRGLNIFTPMGIKNLFLNFLRNTVSWYYVGRDFRKKGLKVKLSELSSQASEAYRSFCHARAAGDLAALRDTTTDAFLTVPNSPPSTYPT